MKYYYKGKSLTKQFSKNRYDRILAYIKKGMSVNEAVDYTETKHLWSPSKYKYQGKTGYSLCQEIGLNYRTFLSRVNKGLSIEDSLKIRKTKKQIEWEKEHEQQRTRL